MSDQEVFEGLEVDRLQFEMGGGGTARSTELHLSLGDVVTGTFTAKVVSVKHPLRDGQVIRMQTLNIGEAEIKKVIEHYEAPVPDPTLDDAAK
ncbi:MAG: hypothetical protein M3P43_10370 [Actinomycetota bacterium]|nr:hypothetical protein [Actinomycetota bacterium]